MKYKGFSLIEIVVGLGLTAILLTIVGTTLPTILKSSRKAAAVNLAKSEGAYVMKALVNNIKFARRVECDLGDYKRLEIEKVNSEVGLYVFDDAAVPVAIKFTDGTLSSPGSEETLLTSDRVSVNLAGCADKMFECSSQNRIVTICFGIDNAAGIDVTDQAANANGIIFKTQVGLTNEAN